MTLQWTETPNPSSTAYTRVTWTLQGVPPEQFDDLTIVSHKESVASVVSWSQSAMNRVLVTIEPKGFGVTDIEAVIRSGDQEEMTRHSLFVGHLIIYDRNGQMWCAESQDWHRVYATPETLAAFGVPEQAGMEDLNASIVWLPEPKGILSPTIHSSLPLSEVRELSDDLGLSIPDGQQGGLPAEFDAAQVDITASICFIGCICFVLDMKGINSTVGQENKEGDDLTYLSTQRIEEDK